MKNKIMILTITLLAELASARVLSTTDKRVYYDVEPRVTVQLTKVDSQLSLLTIIGEYNAEEMTAAYQEAKAQHPGLEPYRVDPNAQGDVKISVKGLVFEVSALNGQTGPWFQDQRTISSADAKKIKQALASDYQITLPVSANFEELKVEEELRAPSSVCHRLQARTVKELVLELSRYKKPANVRLDSTFESYKESLLMTCLIPEASSSIRSFDDLLKVRVKVQPLKDEVLGQTLSRKSVSRSYELNYKVKELSLGGN